MEGGVLEEQEGKREVKVGRGGKGHDYNWKPMNVYATHRCPEHMH